MAVEVVLMKFKSGKVRVYESEEAADRDIEECGYKDVQLEMASNTLHLSMVANIGFYTTTGSS